MIVKVSKFKLKFLFTHNEKNGKKYKSGIIFLSVEHKIKKSYMNSSSQRFFNNYSKSKELLSNFYSVIIALFVYKKLNGYTLLIIVFI